MRLYAVEAVDYPAEPTLYYWAENEGDALDQHEEQGADPEREWVASPVWANNVNLKYRGYVVEE